MRKDTAPLKRGRPRAEEPASERIDIRVTPSQLREIDEAAGLAGVDRSKWVRALALRAARRTTK